MNPVEFRSSNAKHPSLVRVSALGVCLCLFAFASGCKQQRYRPAVWPSAEGQTTLPVDASDSRYADQAGSTLPGWRQSGTLPRRALMGGESRRQGTTLPNLNGGLFTGRPGRGTLPNRERTPDHLLPQRNRNWNTLPVEERDFGRNRGNGTTLPNS